MDTPKKLKLFSFGLLLGTFFLFTFLNGKKLSCNYGPESRVINNLKQKKWIYKRKNVNKDTLDLIDFLENSKVIFNKSNTRKDSCKVYHIKGIGKYQEIIMNAENCSKVVNAELIKS